MVGINAVSKNSNYSILSDVDQTLFKGTSLVPATRT